MVTEAVVSLFVTVRSVTVTEPSATVPLTVRLLNAMRWFVIVNTFELVTVRVSAVRSVARATVPVMVRVANRWLAPRVIEPLTLVKVTAEPIDVRVVAEEVSHDPAMESVDAPRFRTAGPLEIRLPLKTDVELVSVSAPDQVMLETKVVLIPGLTTMLYKVCVTRPSAAIVNVVVEEPLSNSTVLNSLPARLAPANVMIWSVVALNVITADPADQDAEVEAFVQFPETIQVSEPNAM